MFKDPEILIDDGTGDNPPPDPSELVKYDFKSDFPAFDDVGVVGGKNLNHNFFRIVEKDRLELIEDYIDNYPFLGLRKFIMSTRAKIHLAAKMIITHSLFDGISLFVIIANSITLALEDPRAET